jgi:hypothetical protein
MEEIEAARGLSPEDELRFVGESFLIEGEEEDE